MITFKAFLEEAKNTSYKNIDKSINRLVNQHEKEIEKRFGKGITDSFPNYQSFFGDLVKYDGGYDAPSSITSEFKKDGKVVRFVTTWDKSFKNVKHKESFIDKRSPNSTVHTLKNGKIQKYED